MQEKNHSNRRRSTGRPAGDPTATLQGYMPEHRETLRQGLRILARIIACAHLRGLAGRSRAIPGAPTENAQGRHPTARRRKGKPGVSNRRNRRITTRWPLLHATMFAYNEGTPSF